MGVPQLIVIVLYALSLGINMAYHGKPKEGKYSLPATIFSAAIMFTLLIWGGFFK